MVNIYSVLGKPCLFSPMFISEYNHGWMIICVYDIVIYVYHDISWDNMGELIWLPSGKRLQFAIENGPVEIVSFPIKHGDFPYVVFCMFTGGYIPCLRSISPWCGNQPSHSGDPRSKSFSSWRSLVMLAWQHPDPTVTRTRCTNRNHHGKLL